VKERGRARGSGCPIYREGEGRGESTGVGEETTAMNSINGHQWGEREGERGRDTAMAVLAWVSSAGRWGRGQASGAGSVLGAALGGCWRLGASGWARHQVAAYWRRGQHAVGHAGAGVELQARGSGRLGAGGAGGRARQLGCGLAWGGPGAGLLAACLGREAKGRRERGRVGGCEREGNQGWRRRLAWEAGGARMAYMGLRVRA
jgi:hypothetical protein